MGWTLLRRMPIADRSPTMAIDERLIGALHVESLRHDMLRVEHEG